MKKRKLANMATTTKGKNRVHHRKPSAIGKRKNRINALVRKNKRAKAAANRLVHKHECLVNSRDKRLAKRRAAYEIEQKKRKEVLEQRIMFARSFSRYSSVDENGKPKTAKYKPTKLPGLNNTVPFIGPQKPVESIVEVEATQLPLAA